MVGEIIKASLWFNSRKENMKKKLEETQYNSGAGINLIGNSSDFFDPNIQFVNLKFDDGSSGTALVKKSSWNECTHLIQECIGNWARNNGLWRKKLTLRSVPIKLKVIKNRKEFYVFK